MIGVISRYPDKIFFNKLKLPYKIIDDYDPDNLFNVDGLFIDWVSKMPVDKDDWMKQASLLQAYIKSGIPIVIYDRSFSLTEKEVKWVKKFNVYLFEPAINSGRIGFTYLPEWIHDFSIKNKECHREYDLVWHSDKLDYYIRDFELWIKEYAISFPENKVAYSTFSISDFKQEEYKKSNIDKIDGKDIYDIGNTTIIIDNEKSYKIGYFNPIYFYSMNRGCLPFIISKHKYFHGLFEGLVVNDLKDMDYFIKTYGKLKKLKNIIIEEIFEKIKNEWTEFTIDDAVEKIRYCYE